MCTTMMLIGNYTCSRSINDKEHLSNPVISYTNFISFLLKLKMQVLLESGNVLQTILNIRSCQARNIYLDSC